jgi:REP element-mobilizing transposase RayT
VGVAREAAGAVISAKSMRVLKGTYGGWRPGAGRPKKGLHASERHKKRERFRIDEPVHVVMRFAPALGALRTEDIATALREAMLTTYARDDFRILHVSLRPSHMHMVVEADGFEPLARGMQGFQISAAKHLNAVISTGKKRRRGGVFLDRYHAQPMATREQARRCLAYVMPKKPLAELAGHERFFAAHALDMLAPLSGRRPVTIRQIVRAELYRALVGEHRAERPPACDGYNCT